MNTEDLIDRLDQYKPLQTYVFGHTPLQVSHFKTAQQKGCDVFDFWHQVLQLRTLRDSIEELSIQKNEVKHQVKECERFWPFWTYKSRKQKIPRLEFQLRKIDRSIQEKSREANLHYSFLKSQYAHFEDLKEEDILARDRDYWTTRLTQQLVKSRLSRALNVGEGDLSAVLSLPQDEQAKIFHALKGGDAENNTLPSS